MERLEGSFRAIVIVTVAMGGFFHALQPALASIPGPALNTVPTSVIRGELIKITGSSFSSCEPQVAAPALAAAPDVEVFWDGNPWVSVITDGSGFVADERVPAEATAGSDQVTAACDNPAVPVSDSPVLASVDVQVLPGPSLQLSTSQAAAGGGVTAAGIGFGQCLGRDLGSDVQLLWDAAPLGSPVGLDENGAFSQDLTIPAAATAGTGHTIAAECYDPATGAVTSGVLTSQPFTVTTPASTPPTSPTIHVNSPTATPATPRTSPTVITGPSPAPVPRPWSPIALAAGAGGGLAVVIVLVAGLVTRARHVRVRPRNGAWVHQHVRTVARPAGAAPPDVKIHRRPGAAALSVGLEPRPDQRGDQHLQEIPR